MSVEIDITYEGSLHCRATHGPSRQTIATDAPVDNGGKGEAFSPTDLVATATGACIVTVMGLVAQRAGIELAGTHIHVAKEMVANPVRRIGTIRVTITMPKGLGLTETQRSRLEHAARMCPVKQSLHPDVNVPVDFVYPE
jgi:putative redox protein